jgi:hypothetical protein
MPTPETSIYCPRQRAYRRRLAEAGEQEVLFRLSNRTIALIDEIKQRRGLRNRGQVLEQENSARELLKLFEQRRATAQQP